MSRVLLIPTLVLLILIPLCYLAAHGNSPRQPAGTQRPIVFVTADDIKTLDVGKMSWANDIRVAMSLWEGLAAYDIHNSLKPIPGAAASWDISPDGKVYTFHLRPDGRWSNGDPVTAQDF